MDLRTQITGYWEACYPALYVLSPEETRVEDVLLGAVADMAGLEIVKKRGIKPQLLLWTITRGWHDDRGDPVDLQGGKLVRVKAGGAVKTESKDPLDALGMMVGFPEFTIACLKDFHAYMDDPRVLRQIRDIAAVYKGTTCRTAVFLSPRLPMTGGREAAGMPAEIAKSVTLVDFALPNQEELGQVLDEFASKNVTVKAPDGDAREALLVAGSGMTTIEFENAAALAWNRHKAFAKAAVETVYAEKAAVIKQGGALECVLNSGQRMSDVGGLDLLKRFFLQRERAFTKEARKFGVDTPKGVMLVGEPGTGKTLSAKAVASMLGLPMLKMDPGALFGSYVGESERNTRNTLQMAEAMAPCLLAIDEIEKGIGMATAQGLTDSGVSSRVVATILTWLQERQRPVYVIATANRVEKIPAELMRAGRFDAVFYVSLPAPEEREEIFQIHLRKKGRSKLPWVDKGLAELAGETDGFSGAEIEQVVARGLLRAFCDGPRELALADLLKEAKALVPLSLAAAEQMEATRKWLAGRAQPASSIAPGLEPPKRGGGRRVGPES